MIREDDEGWLCDVCDMSEECAQSLVRRIFFFFFGPMPPHVLVDFVVLPPGHGNSVKPTSEVGTPMRRSYVVPTM